MEQGTQDQDTHQPTGDVVAVPAPEADSAAAAQLSASRPSRAPIVGIGLALLAVAVIALGIAFVRQGQRLNAEIAGLRAQLAHDVEAAPAAEPAPSAAGSATDKVDALAQRIADLEARTAAAPSAAAAEVQGMRDEGAALEVERLVTFAQQELQITGSVTTAVTALQSADARLARLNRPQYVELRRAIARDIERLHAAPTVDVTGMAIRLDQLQQAIESWPLMADPMQRPAAPDDGRSGRAAGAAAPATIGAMVRAWLGAEFGDLLRIREVSSPDAVLVDAQQQAQIRDRLRLRLLGARIALLARDDRLFRADLGEASNLVAKYFDVRKPIAATALAQVRTLATTPIVIEVPSIADTVAALHVLRTGPAR